MGMMIDGQEFKVKVTTEKIGGEDGPRSFLGSSSEGENLIVIDGSMPKSRQEEVLLHEIIHMADTTLPEFVVQSLSVRLYGILKANKLITGSLMDKVDPKPMTKAEMEAVNRESQEMAEAMAPPFRIATKPASAVYSWKDKDWVSETAPQ